jgi:hypothetical protein
VCSEPAFLKENMISAKKVDILRQKNEHELQITSSHNRVKKARVGSCLTL